MAEERAHAYAPRPGWLAPGGEGGADSQVTGACVSVSSARRWLLEIFGRKRDGRFLPIKNAETRSGETTAAELLVLLS